MRKMKKALTILVVLAMTAALLTACTASTSTPVAGTSSSAATTTTGNGTTKATKDIKDIKIGISVGSLMQERWQREIEMFQTYADENGFELLVQSAENDPQKQVSQVENMLSKGIDVLLVQSIEAAAAAPMVDAAHQDGVPVISYDRFITNADLDYYLTFDLIKVGELEAQFVVDQAPKGNYIWLKGGEEEYTSHPVSEGQRNILQPYIDRGDIKIVLEQWCKNWDPNEALKNTENGLSLANNDIQGVIASNDGTAGGAIQALALQGLAGKVPIAGQDADLAACQRIVEGTQTGTVYKPLVKLNAAAIQLAVALATGADPSNAIDSSLGGRWTKVNNEFKDVDSYLLEVIPINKDNLYDIVIKQDQFHKLEDVYKNIPKDQWPTD